MAYNSVILVILTLVSCHAEWAAQLESRSVVCNIYINISGIRHLFALHSPAYWSHAANINPPFCRRLSKWPTVIVKLCMHCFVRIMSSSTQYILKYLAYRLPMFLRLYSSLTLFKHEVSQSEVIWSNEYRLIERHHTIRVRLKFVFFSGEHYTVSRKTGDDHY